MQRVTSASVSAEGGQTAQIGPGLVVLLGIRRGDERANADAVARKIRALRIFEDDSGRMSRSLADVGGEILCVSNFTLYGDTRRGNRPSFVDAAPPDAAEPLYEQVRQALDARGGQFGARMRLSLVNDGPVTVLVEA